MIGSECMYSSLESSEQFTFGFVSGFLLRQFPGSQLLSLNHAFELGALYVPRSCIDLTGESQNYNKAGKGPLDKYLSVARDSPSQSSCYNLL